MKYLLLTIILFIMGCANPKSQISNELQQKAAAELKTVLHKESKFVKVHAAEFLVWLNIDRGEVKEVFLKENEISGNEPMYRIGIWRVLAQASDSEDERKEWIGKVLAVFSDTTAPDRIHAAETLAKLKTSPLPRFSDATKAALSDPNRMLNIYTRWATSYTSGHNAEESKQFFINNLLNDNDTIIRKISAFVLSKSKNLREKEWATVANRALAEPDTSELKLTLLNTALVTFAGTDRKMFSSIKTALLNDHKNFKADERIGLAQTLADKGECEDVLIAESFLNNENSEGLYETNTPLAADVRAYAAWAILAIHQRNK